MSRKSLGAILFVFALSVPSFAAEPPGRAGREPREISPIVRVIKAIKRFTVGAFGFEITIPKP